MMMKINKLFLFALFAVFAACGGSDDEELIGDWKFIGNAGAEEARQGAVSFVIDNKAYIGLGYNTNNKALGDFVTYNGKWGYDMAKFPGRYRTGATAFAIGKKGYVGLGYGGVDKKDYLKDFYEYNSETNTWREVDSFPAEARMRRDAAGGAIGGKGYVIGGHDAVNSFMDVYEFTPDVNNGKGKWERKGDQQYEGSKRKGASTFVLNDKLYLFGGANNNTMATDFQVFDPKVGTWKQLNQIKNALKNQSFDDEYGNLPREYACAFVMNGKAYVTLGSSSATSNNTTTYEYEPVSDRWYKKTAFEGGPRSAGNAFSLTIDGEERGFVMNGYSGSAYPDDLWEFFPFKEQDTYNN